MARPALRENRLIMSEPAGYSGRPLVAKLGLRPGAVLGLVGAPAGWSPGPLPPGATVTDLDPEPDVMLAFFGSRGELAGAIEGLARRVFPDRSLWIAWPRRAGGHRSDLAERDIRDLALPLGLVDVKVAAIDRDWSGLKLVWRRERRG